MQGRLQKEEEAGLSEDGEFFEVKERRKVQKKRGNTTTKPEKKAKVKEVRKPKRVSDLEHDMDVLDDRLMEIVHRKKGINVTMIAEKPSVAQSISNVLFGKKAIKQKWRKIKSYEYQGVFRDLPAYFSLISVEGHLYW